MPLRPPPHSRDCRPWYWVHSKSGPCGLPRCKGSASARPTGHGGAASAAAAAATTDRRASRAPPAAAALAPER